MVTLNAKFTPSVIGRSPLCIGGVFAMVFSVAMGLLILFTPAACTFVSSLILLLLGFLLIIGMLAFLFGRWKQRR